MQLAPLVIDCSAGIPIEAPAERKTRRRRCDSDECKTAPEAAEYLRVKLQTIHSWIRSGELEAFNVAKPGLSRPRWRITKEALRKFEQSPSRAGAEAKPAKKKRKRAYVDLDSI